MLYEYTTPPDAVRSLTPVNDKTKKKGSGLEQVIHSSWPLNLNCQSRKEIARQGPMLPTEDWHPQLSVPGLARESGRTFANLISSPSLPLINLVEPFGHVLSNRP